MKIDGVPGNCLYLNHSILHAVFWYILPPMWLMTRMLVRGLYGVIRVANGPTQLVVIDSHTTPLAQVTTVDLNPDAQTLTQQDPYLYVEVVTWSC